VNIKWHFTADIP